MSTAFERPPDEVTPDASPGGLSTSLPETLVESAGPTLSDLPLGARLVLRCRKDWRAAAVAGFELDLGRVVLSVASPTGHTYRVRRPLDSPLYFEGHIPILDEISPAACWRAGLARYDVRW